MFTIKDIKAGSIIAYKTFFGQVRVIEVAWVDERDETFGGPIQGIGLDAGLQVFGYLDQVTRIVREPQSV